MSTIAAPRHAGIRTTEVPTWTHRAKQRHTVKRIFVRLIDEHAMIDVSYQVLRAARRVELYLRRWRHRCSSSRARTSFHHKQPLRSNATNTNPVTAPGAVTTDQHTRSPHADKAKRRKEFTRTAAHDES